MKYVQAAMELAYISVHKLNDTVELCIVDSDDEREKERQKIKAKKDAIRQVSDMWAIIYHLLYSIVRVFTFLKSFC